MDLRWLLALFSPLKNTSFRLLYAAQITSLFGSGLTTIALALLAYDLAGDNAGIVLGTALALKMLAYVLFSPIANAVVMHLARKKLLIVLDLVRAAIVFSLPFVAAIWQIYLLILLLNLCSATFTPIFQATIVEVIPDDVQYTKALSLSRLAYDLENILSPSIAALLLIVTSYNDFFIANAMTFIVSALLLTQCKLPKRDLASAPRNFLQRLNEGMQIFKGTPRLRALLAINISVAAVMAMQIVNTVVYVRAELNLTAQALAFVYIGLGIGSVIGAISVPKLLSIYSIRNLMLVGALSASLLLGLGSLEPNVSALILLYMALGFALSLVQTPVGNLLKMSSTEQQRPALFAAQFSLSHAGFLFCYPLAGWLSATFSVQLSFWVMASIALVAALQVLWLWPKQDLLQITHTHPAVEHEHWHSHSDGHHNDHTHDEPVADKPHSHTHEHVKTQHKHHFVIDYQHTHWPR
ncbi:MAG: MFS transporter [Oceanospirillaceae bacterium]